MTFEELSERLAGARSVLVGRAYRNDGALLAVRLKHETAGSQLLLLAYEDGLLQVIDGPHEGRRWDLDSYRTSFRGSTVWPVLLGPDELRRLVRLYHGQEVSTQTWLQSKLSHKLPTHPVIPSSGCCEVLDELVQRFGRLAEGVAEGDAKTVNCNALLQAALLARLFSEAALLSIGMPKDDRLYELMLRHPDLQVEDLSGRFMDGLVEAHFTGRIKPSKTELQAATDGVPGV